jgi:hypothetical protein
VTAADLAGVNIKLARAKIHAAELREKVKRVIGPNLQRLTFCPDPETGKYFLRVYGVPSIEPEWRAIIGDCLFNLRASLDHLAWQLVILDGKEPNRQTQFPIRESPVDKKGDPLPIQLDPAIGRPDILNALEAVQPYMNPATGQPTSDFRLSPLWLVNKLHIIDKHRLLLVVVCVFDPSASYWSHSGGADLAPRFAVNFTPLKEGDVLASYDFQGSTPPADFHINAEIQVALNETDAPRLGVVSVANVLDSWIYWFEDMLISFQHLF